jgi:hypothetical protein
MVRIPLCAIRMPSIVALSSMVLLVGCSADLFNRDVEALDKFSRAYTEFRDIGEEAEGVIQYWGEDHDLCEFWIAFKGAFAHDPTSYDSGRLKKAQTAIVAYDQCVTTILEADVDEVEKLDKAVQRLFETANAIHNPEYRDNAIRAAKYAREAQASVAWFQTLLDQRLRLQRRALSDIVNANGSLVRAAPGLKLGIVGVNKATQGIEYASKKSVAAMQNLKDTFSALKGMTNLKAYPTKDELQEQKKDL